MHQSLQAHVREWLEQAITNTHVHDLLPQMFSLDHLFMKILALIQHLGHEKLALDSPQDSSHLTQLFHALTIPLPDDHEDELLIAAVVSSTAHPCFLCALDHLLILCSLLADIQKDPFRHKALLCALGVTVPSTAPTSGSKLVCTVLDTSLSDPGPAAALSDGASSIGAPTSDF